MQRMLNFLKTNGQAWVLTALKIVWQGTGTPTGAQEGDPNGAYFSFARTGVGTGTITTKDPIAGIVNKSVDLSLATPAAWTCIFGTATQNATTNVWTIPFATFNASGTAADLPAGSALEFTFVWRNGQAKP